MSELSNSDITQRVMEAVIAVAGRRTLGSYTIKIVQMVKQNLQKEYDFLRYITIHDSFYSEDTNLVSISAEINSIDTKKIAEITDRVLREVYLHLDEEAGLYFINEFKECIGDEYVEIIKDMGVNFDHIQNEQNKYYAKQQRKDDNTKKQPSVVPFERKPDTKKPIHEEPSLDYSWGDVSNWKYNNNVCKLYKSDGSILDTLHLDSLVEEYVNRYSKYSEFDQTTSKMIEINKKEYEFLETLYSRDLDIDMAMVMLHISKSEIDGIVQKFLDSEMLQYVSDNEVKLTRKGILYLLEHFQKKN